jgi:hypothetical protein
VGPDQMSTTVSSGARQDEHTQVFFFNEKTQIQALDRTQPSLPMAPGRAGTMTHDY